ncbi:MAG: filamentous hemagglutinin N-terminal domain-containing protein, partial [Rhizonema sp. NSF051]|nr:filamentous hemagglutinin N-terminal domain-containing protein [Rhizonema sp. NSF051]
MSKMGYNWRQLFGIVLGGAYVLGVSCATAQITPDRTLPNNSSVTINGSVFNITGGTQAGRNLFHSFQQFSVPTGGTASFNNGLDIQNIFSRVTGGAVSNIDGLIRANGVANLFFLNPNGIVFGSNAQLNVGGSFVGSTANAIQFGTQGIFSASIPDKSTPLLTINPSALLFIQINPGMITNQSLAPAGVDLTGSFVTGLRVPDGNSLLLVGGNKYSRKINCILLKGACKIY